MKSILEELYFGNQGFLEKIGRSEEYDKVSYKYDKLFEQLLEGADEEQKKMLDELFVLTGGLESAAGFTHFKEGFKFCMRLLIEGFGK